MIEIVPTRIIKESLIKRLCNALTKKEKKKLGYIRIVLQPKGRTHIDEIKPKVNLTSSKKPKEGYDCKIGYFSMMRHFAYNGNTYHDFNERFADHLFWCLGAVLYFQRNNNKKFKNLNENREEISPFQNYADKIRDKLWLRAKRKRLLDVYNYNEYGLFSKKRRKYVDGVLHRIKKDKSFAKNMPIVHHTRKIKLGKNYKYSTIELYNKFFGMPYDIEWIRDGEGAGESNVKIRKEFIRFKKKLVPKLPKRAYKTKKGRFFYFTNAGLKKAYRLLMNDFDLFCKFYPMKNRDNQDEDIPEDDILKQNKKSRKIRFEELKQEYRMEGFM